VVNKKKHDRDIVEDIRHLDSIITELNKRKGEFADCSKYLKRTKETIYDASQARLYLSRSGFEVPKNSTDRKSKINIDTSNVTLIKSADYSKPWHAK